MYFDPRYRVLRSTQLRMLVILGLFVLNCCFFRLVFETPIISPILEKLADVLLAMLLYKVVSRELFRYRQAIAQLLASQEHRDRNRIGTVVVGEPPTTRLETD